MLYSSCKNPLVDMVEKNLRIEIEKKVRNDLWDMSIKSQTLGP